MSAAVGEFLAEQRIGAQINAHNHKWTVQTIIEFTKANKQRQLVYETDVAYGFTESLGAVAFFPFFLQNTSLDGENVKGIGDMIFAGQWQFFKKDPHFALTTIGLQMPTGRSSTIPSTGSGTFNIFIELAAYHSSKDWYIGLDVDGFVPIKRRHKHPGFQFLWELKGGRIFTLPLKQESKLYVTLHIDGLLQKQSTFDHLIDPDTGGSVIFFGPLVSFSYGDEILIEFLFQKPIAQNLFGKQPNFDYTGFLTWTVSF
jgi:hypothetical protein